MKYIRTEDVHIIDADASICEKVIKRTFDDESVIAVDELYRLLHLDEECFAGE